MNDFNVCDKAMSHLGISDEERLSIYTLVAAVLHLGNLEFEENLEDAKGKFLLFFIRLFGAICLNFAANFCLLLNWVEEKWTFELKVFSIFLQI